MTLNNVCSKTNFEKIEKKKIQYDFLQTKIIDNIIQCKFNINLTNLTFFFNT